MLLPVDTLSKLRHSRCALSGTSVGVCNGSIRGSCPQRRTESSIFNHRICSQFCLRESFHLELNYYNITSGSRTAWKTHLPSIYLHCRFLHFLLWILLPCMRLKLLSKLDSTCPCFVYQKEICSASSLHFRFEEPHSYHGILIYGHSLLYKDNTFKCGNLWCICQKQATDSIPFEVRMSCVKETGNTFINSMHVYARWTHTGVILVRTMKSRKNTDYDNDKDILGVRPHFKRNEGRDYPVSAFKDINCAETKATESPGVYAVDAGGGGGSTARLSGIAVEPPFRFRCGTLHST